MHSYTHTVTSGLFRKSRRLCLAALATFCSSIPVSASAGWWQEVFFEGFDAPLDTSKWYIYNSVGHANNGLRRPSAVSVGDSMLTIKAKMVDGQLVSGGIATTQNFQYGRFEFRVRTLQAADNSTSGVVLTWPITDVWPAEGENDIYETMENGARSQFETNIHYLDSVGAHHAWKAEYPAAPSWQWWTVAMDWTPDGIRIYRKQENAPFRPDELPVAVLDDPAKVPDYLHRLCIQLDAYQPTMTGEAVMQVAWARVYEWDDSATPPSTLPPLIKDGGTYRISPYLATGRCLEVPLGVDGNGTEVINYDYYDLFNQLWLITDDGGGYWRLSPLSAQDKALDVNGGASADGTRVQIWSHNTSSAQRWQILHTGNGWYQLKPQCSPGSALSLKTGDPANGTPFYLWTDYDTDPQFFRVQLFSEP